MDWFLYHRDHRHESVKQHFVTIQIFAGEKRFIVSYLLLLIMMFWKVIPYRFYDGINNKISNFWLLQFWLALRIELTVRSICTESGGALSKCAYKNFAKFTGNICAIVSFLIKLPRTTKMLTGALLLF